MRRFSSRVLCWLLSVAVLPAAHAGVCYVTKSGASTNTGTSWGSPYDLQTALGTPTCTEIWVAAGVYKPTTGSVRTISFNVPAGAAVYGGFAGTETSRSQRNPMAHLTVLSGDLNGDDTDVNSGNGVDATVSANNADNSYNVVVMNGTGTPITSGTVLDGLTITGGNANGSTAQTQGGGALFCNGEGGNCSPTLSNLVFSGNSAMFGGALYADGTSSGTSSPTLTADTFGGNKATNYGGAVYLSGNSGNNSPTFTNVTFGGNSAPIGGSGGSGGAITSSGSSPTLTNVTFSGNTAANYGGALYQSGSGSATLTNVILVDDNAYGNTEVFDDGTAGITLQYSVVWSSSAGSGGCPPTPFGGYLLCSNMVYNDPRLGPLQNNGGSTPTFLPGMGSAAIDAGIDAPTCPGTDQRGVVRPQGLHCDIGAVEVQRTLPCYVDQAATTGAKNGFDWADAFVDLQSALATAGCSEIWVAKGLYKPTTGTDQTISFAIPSGTAVYGGFAGNETLRSARNPQQNPTVLSGDLAGNDTGAKDGIDASVPIDGTNSDNSTHVVYFDGRTTPITATTVLDGFVITAGFANGVFPDDSGGGMLCNANHSGTGVCSPTLSRLVFSGNYASSSTGGGGALHNDGYSGIASPTLTDIVFSGNVSGATGGAMRNDSYGNGSASSPTLNRVTFSDNTAGSTTSATGDGGALFNNGQSGGVSSPTLTNVTFSGNVSGNSGGAITNNNNASPLLTNVTFSGNKALYYGGAIENNSSSPAHPSLSNAILWTDTIIDGAGGGPEIIDTTGTLTLDHSIVQGGCLSPTVCTNLVAGDPKLGALANNGGFTPTYLPGTGSAAIDAGTNTGCPATDQRGIARPQGLRCDIGAVEVVAYDRIFADNFDGTPTP